MKFINSIFFKLFMTFVLFSFIPMGIVGWFAYDKYSNNLYENLQYHADDVLEQKMSFLSAFIKDLERMDQGITQSKIFSEFLTNTNPIDHPKYYIELDELLLSIQNIRPETEGIMIVSNNGFIYNYGYSHDLHFKNQDFKNLPWVKEIEKNNYVTPQITYLHDQPYSNVDKKQKVYSYVKKVWDRKIKSYGYLIIDFKEDLLEAILRHDGSTSFTSSGTFIHDSLGFVLEPEINLEYKDVAASISGSTIKSNSGKEFIVFTKYFPQTGWYVSEYFEKNAFYVTVNEIRKIAIIITITSAFICLLASLFISHRISTPIKNLGRVMKKVESGNLDERFVVHSKDEIGDLGKGFNTMIGELKKLIQAVKHEEKLKKEAEITALQLQINPHFIYNTLETINSLARKKREPEISRLIVLLGKLLRSSISSFEEKIPIKQEINYIVNYLEIQKVRMREPLNYTISIDPMLDEYLSVKWILQPIVENAIIHGIDPLKSSGNIEIIGENRGSIIIFTIKDNGVGLDSLKLQQIRHQLQFSSKNLAKYKNKIGIYNVQTRILSHYGSPFGITIDSEVNLGTTVTISIPMEVYDAQNVNSR
ncbi:two-component system sensor histidine kinase YesM [Neobacillus niacini]|uniref:sensor histidine kinase n=1 Tax=Neobacillus niacini TaxID=86668 RepID=UPI002854ED6F|nr:sensor histidine kinase [Neobacillus niacini]MDR7079330.1 two-component system sensor histidine kinase YesM [Neobacillus niacini]